MAYPDRARTTPWAPRGLLRVRSAAGMVLLCLAAFTGAAAVHAAFTATTANGGDTLSAGSVAVETNGTAPLLTISDGAPGAVDTACLRTTSTGTLPSTLKHYATTTGNVASSLDVRVEKGSGAAGYDSCTGFTPHPVDYRGLGNGVVYTGTLTGLGTDWATGTPDPGPAVQPGTGYGPTVAGTSGLVNHWRLGGPSTTTFTDTKGGATGTWTGSPTTTPGVPGGDGTPATSFDGVDDTGRAPTSLTGDDFTVAFWFRSTQGRGPVGYWWESAGLVDNSTNGGYFPEWGIALSANGTVVAGLGDGSTDRNAYSAPGNNDGQWHHVAVTYVRATGALALHLDGQLVSTVTSPLKPLVRGRGELLLGYVDGRAATNAFAGALDEVTTHDRALSATEIARLHAAQVAGVEVWTAGEAHDYRITTTVRGDATPGTSGSVTLRWETRNR